MVYKTKRDEHGQIVKFKARVCARGDRQTFGVDYTETFAPVVRHSTLRLLLATATQHDMHVESSDVTTAYLYAANEETVYVFIPEGMIIDVERLKPQHTNDEQRDQIVDLIQQHGIRRGRTSYEITKHVRDRIVIKLVQALYGMKQAGRAWNTCLNDVLTTKLEFERSKADTCLYFKQGLESMIWVAVFVDDILQVSRSQHEIVFIFIFILMFPLNSIRFGNRNQVNFVVFH